MPPPGSGSLYFLNPKGKVHILASPDGQVFKCGRKWKSSMISVKSLGKGAETCSQCDPSASSRRGLTSSKPSIGSFRGEHPRV